MKHLRVLLIRLDRILTGKDYQSAKQMYENQEPNIDEFLLGGSEYYLSDGGYSRLVFEEESGILFRTSNSTDRVKCQWDTEDCQTSVLHLEWYRRGWYDTQEALQNE